MNLETLCDAPNEPCVLIPKSSIVTHRPSISAQKPNHYKNVMILHSIGKAKFPVYLASCKNHLRPYAMKVFPVGEEAAQQYFENEIRFASLSHENIIQTVHTEKNKELVYKGAPKTINFILMEYAPYHDLFDFLNKYKQYINETFARTFFRQLINGLEYLHEKGVAHLDIKLENILIGEGYTLKIADFDLSCFVKENIVRTRGTKFFRAPELMRGGCKNLEAADIYSAAIILFILKSGGLIPHAEDSLFQGINLFELLCNNTAEFWKRHCELQNKEMSYFSRDFRDLFIGMTKLDPSERWTIKQIKESKWWNGPIYSKKEVQSYVQGFMDVGQTP